MSIDKAERKENLQILKKVLNVLNNINTSVEKQDDKYIVVQNNDKKYEIIINPENTAIRAFNNGTRGNWQIVWKEGLDVRAKLWQLKFELQDRTDQKPFEVFVNKAKAFKSEMDLTNDILTALIFPETKVSVVHETTLMKKYEVEYDMYDKSGKMTIEFDGYVIKYNDKQYFEKQGYLGWKWDLVRRKLDKFIANSERAKKSKQNVFGKSR